jgi:hypothetical protein
MYRHLRHLHMQRLYFIVVHSLLYCLFRPAEEVVSKYFELGKQDQVGRFHGGNRQLADQQGTVKG